MVNTTFFVSTAHMARDRVMSRHEAAYPDRLTEWLFACMMMIWGVVLFMPFGAFENPQYAVLKLIAPEEVWGAFSISIALLRLTALWINGSWRRTPAIRCACSILGVVWWLVLIFCIFAADTPRPPPPGAFWYPVFIIFEGISCWRSAADGFHSKAFQREVRSRA